jgi:hypothetical protein
VSTTHLHHRLPCEPSWLQVSSKGFVCLPCQQDKIALKVTHGSAAVTPCHGSLHTGRIADPCSQQPVCLCPAEAEQDHARGPQTLSSTPPHAGRLPHDMPLDDQADGVQVSSTRCQHSPECSCNTPALSADAAPSMPSCQFGILGMTSASLGGVHRSVDIGPELVQHTRRLWLCYCSCATSWCFLRGGSGFLDMFCLILVTSRADPTAKEPALT